MQDTTILEVGLGFGTLSQYLAEQQTTYIGLDVSLGPTRMVQHRLKQCNLKGEVVSGSINTSPFADKSFDAIIAIGSLHHTGDLTRSIEEVHRLLKPGGKFIFMVYYSYSYSYRRWRQAFKQTLNYFIKEIFEYRGVVPNLSSAKNRAAYDVNKKGEAAPHTDWISKKSAKALLRKFSHISLELENIDEAFAFGFKSREKLVISKWPKKFGLDLYGEATK